MFTYKTLIRDKLVDNATVKGIFGAAATGSCNIRMEFINASASYPQVVIGYGGGQTTPNMDADESRIYLTIECKGSGSIHAYQEIGKMRSAILSVIDDTSFASTAVAYHCRKFSEVEGYSEDEKVYWWRGGFSCFFKQNANYT